MFYSSSLMCNYDLSHMFDICVEDNRSGREHNSVIYTADYV